MNGGGGFMTPASYAESLMDSPVYSDVSTQGSPITPAPAFSQRATSWVSQPSPKQLAKRQAAKEAKAAAANGDDGGMRHRKNLSLDIEEVLASLALEANAPAKQSQVTLQKVLGEGAQSVVRAAIYHGMRVAAKVPRSRAAYAAIRREAAILRHLQQMSGAIRHTAEIVACVDEQASPTLVLERAQCDLWQMIQKERGRSLRTSPLFGQRKWRHLAREATSAVEYLHQAGFIHGDLKPENFLAFTGNEADGHYLKLADFEAAIATAADSPFAANHQAHIGVAGTHYTTAPERLSRYDTGPTCAADCFALGVTLLVLATGNQPYAEARTGIAVVLMAQAGEPVAYAQEKGRLTKSVLGVVNGLCAKDPADRWTAAQALAYLDALDN
jgi:serine/threonine protein kinase